ncbi:CBS domain-containing protein [Clostridium neuense]|uniref:CBS domain-containing protein n=1 Tax=Clostridium neuense TaxID=1728934 RepID=A0ABW8TAS7_9CLOT
MNVAFFLTPKKQVVYAKLTSTIRQIFERMRYYNCMQIIILNNKGEYAGVISKDDLIAKITASPKLEFKDLNKVGIFDIVKHMINKPIGIDCEIEEVENSMKNKNFLPVVDDNNVFIGIVKKEDIINYKNSYIQYSY